MKWETVIGLETHVELSTRTKMFCSCSTAFGGEKNTRCCPVCAGMPGALPVLNRKAVEYGIKAGLALGCSVSPRLCFDRKNYFYPDLPKGYQISQLYSPLCRNGAVAVTVGEREKTVRISELHLEEDAGKILRRSGDTAVQIDHNRCGIPLIEIVTRPDFRCAEEVVAYLEELRSILKYLEVSDCRMEEGSLRCDVNLSVRHAGSDVLGTRTEMKNLSSFRGVSRAIAYESQRQIALLESGGTVLRETRRWDEEKEISISMRTKEELRDYRYFPEPDLPPLTVSPEEVEAAAASIPELPREKRLRYRNSWGIREYDAGILAGERALAELFEGAAALGAPPGEAANWILGEVLCCLGEKQPQTGEVPLSPVALAKLIAMVSSGEINRNTGAKVVKAVFETGEEPEDYVKRNGLMQISDPHRLREAVRWVLREYPDPVKEYRFGKEKAFGFLMGRSMHRLEGRGDPAALRKILKEEIDIM